MPAGSWRLFPDAGTLRLMAAGAVAVDHDDDLVTVAPHFEDGHLVLDDSPGWGTEPVLEAIAERPPREGNGLVDARRHDS